MDLPLVERLAGPAREQGSVQAAILCAYTYNLMSRAAEAEAIFACLDLAALDEDQRCSVTTVRAANRLWPMADPELSWMLIDDAWAQRPTTAMQQTLQAVRSMQLASAARPHEAITAAQAVPVDRLPAVAGLVAVWALVIALGDTGAISRATRIALRGYARAATAPEATYPGVGLADHHVTALLLAGQIRDAQDTAARTRTRCADMPGIASTVATAICGLAALGRGDLTAARSEILSAKTVFVQLGEPSTLCYRFSIVTVEVLARLGDLHGAAAELAAMMRLRHPAFDYLEADRLLATAWLTAARGAVSQAIAAARFAATYAHDHGQHAREVMCLQTATQFGDKRCARRLLELTDIVEGPRADAAATYAAGLAATDADTLCEASEKFAAMGDILAAADASAHAAMGYRNLGLRGSALTAAGRAQRLARDGGGARSPALRESTQPLPLTTREREVIALVSQSLSNQQIADVLGISVRTVEGHLHRAGVRTGIRTRRELAALVSDGVSRWASASGG
ncbi:helix-turn-helix domain-containing protein [Mycolicibacterium chubuense]|uniref:helix-turn-helix domain-containing protein n=1 Tax=Mycolicibacterium chubuense TaxID=1800 RepID=UPI0006887F06|nr:helix-turn-helix transcriptional regulator [Mycolicibacterium chubuense]